MITIRDKCRLCNSSTHDVFKLKPTAIANSYPVDNSNYELFPLELIQCNNCEHVQLKHVLDNLFEDYKYSTPKTVSRYVEPLALEISQKYPKAKILEIGCNNGVLIDCFLKHNIDIIGVDPSTNHKKGIKAYFNTQLASSLPKFNIVIANNVLAHIDDLNDVFNGIDTILAKDGILIFECQYLPSLIECGGFDMIYHEHMSYHTLNPLKTFLKKFNLIMVDYLIINNHGGSIRVTAKRKGIEATVKKEILDWDLLRKKINKAKNNVLNAYKKYGKMVCFGAAAKATTLISELECKDYISHCVDDTPQKQYRYIPGTDIMIYPTNILKSSDTVLLTAWNYEKEISEMIPNKLINPFKEVT